MRRRSWRWLQAVGIAALVIVVTVYGGDLISSRLEYSFLESVGIVLVVYVVIFLVFVLEEAV